MSHSITSSHQSSQNFVPTTRREKCVIANENPDVTWRNDRRRRDEHQEEKGVEVVSSLPLRQKLRNRIVLLEGTTERKLIRLVS